MSELWKELHERALTFKGKDDKLFLIQFAGKIPRYTSKTGCKCQEFWVQLIKKHPPKFGNNGEYFEWSVFCHNEVNKKLGKKIFSLEEAKKLTLAGMKK